MKISDRERQDRRNARLVERTKNDPEYRERKRKASERWRNENREKYEVQQSEKYQRRKKVILNKYMQNKKECADYLGGKCCGCGADNLIVLQFHHRDPEMKQYALNKKFRRMAMKLEDVQQELDKCVLLCANCHTLEHAPISWH